VPIFAGKPARSLTSTWDANRFARLADRINETELRLVRLASRAADSPIQRRLAILFSRLGNGWFYPLLFVILIVKWGSFSLRIAGPAAVNAGLLHAIYPLLKARCARRRPFQVDRRLNSLLDVLDQHSFPSGHAMTVSGVLTPVVMYWPEAAFSAIFVGAGIAWSRIASAHHYPSDVLAGTILGVGVGYPAARVVTALLG
jgi:undecaprenyl-diphosphatase